MSYQVLLIEDDAAVRFGIRDFMSRKGIELREAVDCSGGLSSYRGARPDAAIVDHRLPDGEGVELIARLRSVDSTVPIIILTGHGSIDLAVRAMRAGASNFLTKPVELVALEHAIKRAVELARARTEPADGASSLSLVVNPFAGQSAAVKKLEEDAHRIVKSTSPKLIVGETGAGKGVLARWLHANGPHAQGSFVDLNCATLSRELLESELFGHERGSFTGATAQKQGLLEAASRGTLFLDEIGEMDTTIQPKVLKALEEGRVRRLGSIRDHEVALHLVAATHRNLVDAVKEGSFRSDLYFRIATIPLEVPPLRKRLEDVPLLVNGILAELAKRENREQLPIGADAMNAILGYRWPGNIRELRNVLECAVLLSDSGEIDREHLRFAFEAKSRAPMSSAPPASLSLTDVERMHIERVLKQEGGCVEDAARALGVPRSTLYFKIKRHGIVPSKI